MDVTAVFYTSFWCCGRSEDGAAGAWTTRAGKARAPRRPGTGYGRRSGQPWSSCQSRVERRCRCDRLAPARASHVVGRWWWYCPAYRRFGCWFYIVRDWQLRSRRLVADWGPCYVYKTHCIPYIYSIFRDFSCMYLDRFLFGSSTM